ncbi:hypothetical protein PY092_12680 [Muricauda sp. 334s03]|uniref:DUF4136 domain-containing protein n=1 Tax=Flagellimonas yonaguniensis TaxID=3031325 RepID=A0ABT5Y0T7_9FLAO|nr:hypothetical protein [[Muricauda] yonaguniensis]MDF0717010.1 hypothetical protein [[Muricauda] yonaguniensis]
MTRKLSVSLIVLCFVSCAGGKYNYLFDTGKQLDFSQGKWILNRTESNSRIFDSELYRASFEGFKDIIGDSLFDLNSIRAHKMVPPKIAFEPSPKELKQIGQSTDCDYLINIRGNIISNGAGILSYDSGNGYYSASNQSSISIIIYELTNGTIISSSQALAKDTAENSHFDENTNVPTFHSSAETMMVKAAKNLIKKYDSNRLDR